MEKIKGKLKRPKGILVTTTSWAHQIEAFHFVEELWKNGRRGAMLAMAMGTGKTKVAIDLSLAIGARLILILCPLRVVEVWQREYWKHAQHSETWALDDRYRSVAAKKWAAEGAVRWLLEQPGRRAVIAINYESARLDPFASWALANVWDLIIADEAHRLKQPSGSSSKFADKLRLRAHYRLALTGTPMAHEPTDIWGQFRFLDPSVLDRTYGYFRRRYAVLSAYYPSRPIGWQNLDELREKFSTIAFQVSSDVLDLPPEIDEKLYTTLEPKGARMYRELEEELITWIDTTEPAVVAANAMVKLTKLQQITSGTVINEIGEPVQVDPAKEKLLTDFLEDLEGAEPVVVFGLFKSDLRAIHRAAAVNGLESVELSGNRDERAKWRGIDPTAKANVLAVQIQAGEVGIDLSGARYGVYYALSFSLATYLQSRARIRRPPQTRPVTFYHLLVRDSIDERVLQALERREELIARILVDQYRRKHAVA